MTTKLLPFGATVKISTEMRDRDSAGCPLFDPAIVSFAFWKPDATQVSLVYGVDNEIVRTATGKYYCEIVGDQAGAWTYQITSSGPGGAEPIGKDDGTFSIGLNPAL